MFKKSLLVVSVAAALSLAGCLGGSGGTAATTTTPTTPVDTTKVVVSGSFGSTYSFFERDWLDYFFPKATAAFGNVRKLIAVPMMVGDSSISTEQFRYAKTVDVDDSGNFSLDLPKQLTVEMEGQTETIDVNWLIIVDRTDNTLDFLSVSDGGESLLNIPVVNFTDGTLNLGTIVRSNDVREAQSSIGFSGIADASNLSETDVQSLAQSDDALKSISNIYRNCYVAHNNDVDKCIDFKLHVVSAGNYANITTEYDKADFVGYAFHFHGGANSVITQNALNICRTSNSLSLMAPSGASVAVGGNTKSNFTNTGMNQSFNPNNGSFSCGGNAFYLRKNTGSDYTYSIVNFITGDSAGMLASTKPIPSGLWDLTYNNNSIGKYDLSYSLPVDAYSSLKTPIPAIKLDTDSNGKITKLNIEWYNSQNQRMSPAEVALALPSFDFRLTSFGRGFNDNRTEIGCREFNVRESAFDINAANCSSEYDDDYEDRYYSPSSDDYKEAKMLNINYYLGSTEYRFSWRNDGI